MMHGAREGASSREGERESGSHIFASDRSRDRTSPARAARCCCVGGAGDGTLSLALALELYLMWCHRRLTGSGGSKSPQTKNGKRSRGGSADGCRDAVASMPSPWDPQLLSPPLQDPWLDLALWTRVYSLACVYPTRLQCPCSCCYYFLLLLRFSFQGNGVDVTNFLGHIYAIYRSIINYVHNYICLW